MGKTSCKQGRFRWRKGLKEADGGYWSGTKVNQCWHILTREDVDVLPASILLSDIEIKLVSAMSREYILKTIIDEIKVDYELFQS